MRSRPASQHVTKLAVSANSNSWARVWLDGSLAHTLNPRAKAFADAVFEGKLAGRFDPLASADVGLAHVGQGLCGYEVDAYTTRSPMDGFPSAVHYRVPAAAYVKADLIFALDEAPDKVSYLTVRLARYDNRFGIGCTMLEDAILDLTKGIPATVKEI